jgi:GH15 family glucan-1,4-alpha-glucosidase
MQAQTAMRTGPRGSTLASPLTRLTMQYDWLFERSLIATAIHVDSVNGGVIAGFHNGAYPYVWPRDAVYAAVTLARTGTSPRPAASTTG